MRTFLFGLTLASLAACGGKNNDSGTDAENDFSPMEGTWAWSGLSYDSDECGFEGEFPTSLLEAYQWTLTAQGNSFVLEGVGIDPLSCILDGQDFACDLSLSAELTEWPEGSDNTGDPDAENVLTGTAAGTFSDEMTASGSIGATMVCEGPDCDAFVADAGRPSPCSSELSGDFVMSN
jgi:hypothetical protein